MKRLALIGVVAIVMIAAGPRASSLAQEESEVKKEVYEYTSENRRDPFLSIIEASKLKKEAERAKKKKKGLAPLEDYDLSQFNLIAIVWERNSYYALVGLPDKKFYTITKNTNVGIHGGKVRDITPKTVVVREMLPDYKGEIKPKDTIMRLREEEGE